MGIVRTERLAALASALAMLGLAGCSGGLPSVADINAMNPFAEKQVPLPGKRVAVVLADGATGSIELAAADRPLTLPPPHQNDAWPLPGGVASHSPGHLVLPATIRTAWSADVGQGSSKLGRLTASPIVADGRVFTLDAAGQVTALSQTGSIVWRATLTPEKDKDYKAFGGGLAAEGGRLVRRDRARDRHGARYAGRQEAVGEERRLTGALRADGRFRAGVRGDHRWPHGGAGRARWRRAVGPSRPPGAREPVDRCEPGARRATLSWCLIPQARSWRCRRRPAAGFGRNRWRAPGRRHRSVR